MALATVATMLPLDRFAAIAGIHPLHWNGVTIPDLAEATTCGDPFVQYSWQADNRTGREEVAQVILDVETRLMDFLNFALVPTFFSDVSAPYPRPANPDLLATSLFNNRSLFRSVKLPTGYLISGGQERKDLVTAATAVVYTDTDGDGYAETATIQVTVDPTVVQPTELEVYYPGELGAAQWQVRPVTTAINATSGVATIVMRREQLVVPGLLFGLFATGVDGNDNVAFLGVVDVYRHWLDFSQTQVEFRWQQTPWLPGNAAVVFATQPGAMLITDAKLGWAALEPAHWDAPSQQFVLDILSTARMPDTVRAWFKAGWPLDRNGNMDGLWERCITYMALASLNRPLCACDSLRTFTEYWSYDPAENTPEKTHQISRTRLDNPFGTNRAAQYTWTQINRLRLPDV